MSPNTPAPDREASRPAAPEAVAGPARRAPSRPTLWRRFDWPRLLYAAIVAVLLWGYIDYKRMVELAVDVPVRLSLPADWQETGARHTARAKGADARWVRVTLTGNHRAMTSELRPDALAIAPRLALADVNTDSTEVMLALNAADLAELPQGVAVVRFDPPVLNVQLTRLVTVALPVELVTTGVPEAGFVDSRQYRLEPMTAEVRLPKTLKESLQPADTLKTAPFDLTGRRMIASGRVALLPFRKDGYEAVPSQAAVWATVDLDVKPARREVPDVPVSLLLSPSPLGQAFADFRFVPSRVTVTLEGPPGTLERLDPRALVAYADAQESVPLGNGGYSLRCRAIPPEGGKIVKIEPEAVRWAPAER